MAETVAIMQPYFFPYAGYFRLFYAADLFVVLDSVQFPRRGWVHRNQFTDANGEKQWLTLPLTKADRDSTHISDLKFHPDAPQLFVEQTRRFPCFANIAQQFPDLHALLVNFHESPCEYLVSTLKWTAQHLGIAKPMVRASELAVSDELKGQERILEIAGAVGATRYVNPPGGRELYQATDFSSRGIGLSFLSEHAGSYVSVLERILLGQRDALRQEIQDNAILTTPA